MSRGFPCCIRSRSSSAAAAPSHTHRYQLGIVVAHSDRRCGWQCCRCDFGDATSIRSDVMLISSDFSLQSLFQMHNFSFVLPLIFQQLIDVPLLITIICGPSVATPRNHVECSNIPRTQANPDGRNDCSPKNGMNLNL